MNTTTCLATLMLVPVVAVSQQVTEQTTCYNVTGATPNAIRQSIDQGKPADPRGQRHDALTKWDLRLNYRTMPASGGCAPTSIDVTLAIQMILPKWVNESSGAADVVNSWRRYSAATLTHENGHKQVAVAGATQLRNEALQQRRANCNELGQVIEAMTKSAIERVRGRQDLYDQQTDHGGSQGARFP